MLVRESRSVRNARAGVRSTLHSGWRLSWPAFLSRASEDRGTTTDARYYCR